MRSVLQPNRRRVLTVVVLLISWLAAAGIGTAGEVRQWSSRQAGVTFAAEFVGLKGMIVMLKATDGKTYAMPLANLSPEDVSYVEKMSRTEKGEFVDWTDGLGNKLKVRYAGITGRAVLLVTQEGGSLQVPWDRLDAKQQVYVIQAQQAAIAEYFDRAEAPRRWMRLENGIELVTLNAEEVPDDNRRSRINCLKFSADNHLLLSSSERHTAVWNVDSCRKQSQLERDKYSLSCFAFEGSPWEVDRFFFDPTGRQVWWLNGDHLFKWDALAGRSLLNAVSGRMDEQARIELRRFAHSFPDPGRHTFVFHIAYSPERRLVAIAVVGDDAGRDDAGIWILNPKSWDRLEKMDGVTDGEGIHELWFSPDGKVLVAQSDKSGEGGIHVWDLATRRHQLVKSRYSSDKFAGVADRGKAVAYKGSGEITLFSTSTGDVYKNLELLGKERVDGQAWVSPVGSLVAITYRGTVYLDDWSTAESKATLTSHEADVTRMTFSSDGSMLATGDAQGRVKLWKVASLTARTDNGK